MDQTLIFAFQLTVLGIGVVFFALTAIMYTIKALDLLRPFLEQFQSTHGHAAHDAAPASAQEAPTPGDVTPEVVAIIGAAVTMTMGKRARVTRISRPATRGTAWASQGRVTIMGSHTVRR
jgi:Na+-transporting methylmalonyl-CoA/oxaloacetate decarboxylase gamma subunit